MGRYEASVDELFENHIYPQENGNRGRIRWLSIENSRGFGLFATGGTLFNFAARHYTDSNLEKARHTNELVRLDETILCLDHLVSCLLYTS